MTLPHYQSVLCELFHYVRENPQIQALAAVYFRGDDRQQVKAFFRHATSEIGHDMLALDDLTRLGIDASKVPETRPLPATRALTSFAFYQISYDRPIGYLGYLYFLEYMPTQYGKTLAGALLSAGVPVEAMSFLQEHMTVDVGHNQLMQKYLVALVHSDADLEAITYALHATGELYAQMLWAAIQRAESGADYGVNIREAQTRDLTINA